MKNEEETLFGIWNSFRNISENICSFPYPLLGDPSQEDVAVVLTLHGMSERSYSWLLKEPIPNIFQISVDRISHGLSSSLPAGTKRFEFKDGCGDLLEVKPFQGDAWILNWITPKFWEARPRLYRRRFLQENIHWKALDEIYNIHVFNIYMFNLDVHENGNRVLSTYFFTAQTSALQFRIVKSFRRFSDWNWIVFFHSKIEFFSQLHFLCNFSFRFRIGAEPLAISRRALALEVASTF